jgi:hypothetical protein
MPRMSGSLHLMLSIGNLKYDLMVILETKGVLWRLLSKPKLYSLTLARGPSHTTD